MSREIFRPSCSNLALALVLAVGLLGPVASLAQNDKAPPSSSSSSESEDQQAPAAKPADNKPQNSVPSGMTRLKIRVTNDKDNPVANASVYVRFNTSGGFLRHDKLAEMNFKTNQDGSVKVPDIPQGKILIQVIATGWHTFGQWYDVDKQEESIAIKLAPPPHWY
jgi:hypothetical protein